MIKLFSVLYQNIYHYYFNNFELKQKQNTIQHFTIIIIYFYDLQ
jgi:hypothetical protein